MGRLRSRSKKYCDIECPGVSSVNVGTTVRPAAAPHSLWCQNPSVRILISSSRTVVVLVCPLNAFRSEFSLFKVPVCCRDGPRLSLGHSRSLCGGRLRCAPGVCDHVAVQEVRAQHLPQDQVLQLLSAERGAFGRSPGMQPGESRYVCIPIHTHRAEKIFWSRSFGCASAPSLTRLPRWARSLTKVPLHKKWPFWGPPRAAITATCSLPGV